MVLAHAKADLTDARLNCLTVPNGASWATEARSAAVARVRAMGLPTRRDEYWKYTNPAALTSVDAATVNDAADAEAVFGATDALRIVFVDGAFDADASDAPAADGMEIETLGSALTADIHWARDVFGALESKGQTPVDRPLAALNIASATEGMVIRATGKVSKPVLIEYRQTTGVADAMIHHVVKIDADADLTVLETGTAGARVNTVLEVDVADSAAFHHVRTQGRDHDRAVTTHCFARVASEATFKSFTLTANGTLTRNECVIDIVGDNAVAHVAGACVGDGRDFHHDDTVFITHDAVNCESRQVFKKVLRNGATGVFQGKILVKEGAQKTDGYQISQSLLLEDDSQFLAKPELEIYADDVACSHGSTSGAIDEMALFYLRSRGVRHADAISLLTLAFLAEALEEIEDEGLSEAIRDRLEIWLAC